MLCKCLYYKCITKFKFLQIVIIDGKYVIIKLMKINWPLIAVSSPNTKMQILQSLLLVLIGAGLTLLGDVFLKKSQMQNYNFLALGLLFYACGVIPVAIIFKKMEFGTVFLVWEAVTVIVAMVIASWYFKETFTVSKALAITFALVALYFSYK